MKLCYVDPDSRIMYFTDTPIDKVWGDDWNDAPWEHNAGDPYHQFGPFKRLIIAGELDLPGEGLLNSSYSVEQINMGIVPWLKSESWAFHRVEIKAGAEFDYVVQLCKENKLPYFVEVTE